MWIINIFIERRLVFKPKGATGYDQKKEKDIHHRRISLHLPIVTNS